MPTIIGYHDARDTKHWLASPKRKQFFGAIGVTGIREFVDPQESNRVAVLMDAQDIGSPKSTDSAWLRATRLDRRDGLGEPAPTQERDRE